MQIIDASRTIFVYTNEDKEIKVLWLEEAIEQSKELSKGKWEHIDTIEPKMFIHSVFQNLGTPKTFNKP